MSEGDSPHGGSISENDPNSSIINKVKSRVSSILPNSISKWFSPSRNDSKNGSLRRRRESSSEDENVNANVENNRDECSYIEPSNKKTRYSMIKKTSTPTLEMSNSSPGTSGIMNRSLSGGRQLSSSHNSFTTTTTTSNVNRRFSPTTPTSILMSRNRRYLGLNKSATSTPYDFQSINPSLTKNINLTNNNDGDQQNVIQINDDDDDVIELDDEMNVVVTDGADKNSPTDVRGRRNIHENCSIVEHPANDLDLPGKRRCLGNAAGKQTRQSLNVPVINSGGHHLINTRGSSATYRTAGNDSFIEQETIEEEVEEEEEGGQDTVDDITLQIEENDEQNMNGLNSTPSESEVSISSYIDRPSSSVSKRNDDDDVGGSGDGGPGSLRQQYSGGLFGRNSSKNIHSSSTTGINFAAHLQSEKSLFSDKNLSSGLTNSTMSLNSWNRRPSFNASLYGSTSALSDSRLMSVKSPFYDGKTMYGGSSTYTKNLNRMNQKALRVPVQIRPSSSLSTTSSNNSADNNNKNAAISNTAKRILELMNQLTGPINDAKKMVNTNISRIAPLSQRQRFSEEELQLNRSIRLNVPYGRRPGAEPIKKIQPLNRSFTTELQIPTVSQLIQMKRLQNNTEQMRELANASKSVLNTNKIDYQLPSNEADPNDENVSRKHISKMKNKISSVRQDKKTVNLEEMTPELNLPNISFPEMKSVPRIDIAINNPITSSVSKLPPKTNSSLGFINKITNSTAALSSSSSSLIGLKSGTTENNSTSQMKNVFGMSLSNAGNKKPTTDVASTGGGDDDSFKFSSPIKIDSSQTSTPSTMKPLSNFKFSEPIKIDSFNSSTSMSTSSSSIVTASLQFNFTPSENGGTTVKMTNNKLEDNKLDSGTNYESSVGSINHGVKVSELKKGSVLDALKSFNHKIKPTQSSPPMERINLIDEDDDDDDDSGGVGGKRKKPSGITPISSFGDKFKPTSDTWECEVCMVRNKVDLFKCVACESRKPNSNPTSSSKSPLGGNIPFGMPSPAWGSLASVSSATAPITSSFGDKFKPKSDTWECDVCMVRNDGNVTACVSCTTPKPGGSSAPPKPSFSFGAQAPPISAPSLSVPVDDTFKKLAAKQNEKWECSTCMTRNESNKKKCACCEQAKPGEVIADAPKFTFGVKPGGGFTFGVPLSSGTSSTSTTSTATATTTTTAGFIFGAKPPTDKNVVITSTSAAIIPTISFGTQPKGIASAKCDEKDGKTTLAAPTGFVFGSSPKPVTDLTDAPPKNQLSFGKAADKPSESKSSASATPAPTSFGIDSKATPAQVFGNLGTLVKPSATKTDGSATDAINFGDNKTKSGFTFGASTTKPIVSEKTSAEGDAKPRIGGFSFSGSPSAVTPTTTSLTFGTSSPAQSSPLAFGSSLSKPTTTFGSPTLKPAAVTSSLSAIPTVTPSFGANSASSAFVNNLTTSASTAVKPTFGSNSTSTITTGPSIPTFSEISSINTASSTEAKPGTFSTGFSSFGNQPSSATGAASKEEPKTFGSFPATKPAENPFGTPNTNPPSTIAPPTFGAAPQPSTSPFSFSSTGGVGGSSAATNSPAAFSFRGSNAPNANVAPTTNAFGPGLNQTTPTFGQQNTSTPAVFGSFSAGSSAANSANPSPVFGAASGSFEQSNNNTPKFGTATTPVFGQSATVPTPSPAFGSSTTLFGSPQNTQPNTFGAPTNAPPFGSNMFGTDNDTSEPIAKKTSAPFTFGAANNTQPPQQQQNNTPFMFGAAGNNNNNTPAKTPFNFVPTSTPSFNFGSPQAPSQAPFAFGQTAQTSSTPFNFGGAQPEPTPNAPFQFGGNDNNQNNNPFTAGQVPQVRRKVKATRRMHPR